MFGKKSSAGSNLENDLVSNCKCKFVLVTSQKQQTENGLFLQWSLHIRPLWSREILHVYVVNQALIFNKKSREMSFPIIWTL